MTHQRSFEPGLAVATEIEVRFGECDPAGVVYYANYFDWFSIGRLKYLEHHGLRYWDFFEAIGVTLVVVEATCRYLRPSLPGDRLRLETALTALTPSRAAFGYRLLSAERPDPDGRHELRAVGTTTHAFATRRGPVDLRKYRPEAWARLDRLNAYLSGWRMEPAREGGERRAD